MWGVRTWIGDSGTGARVSQRRGGRQDRRGLPYRGLDKKKKVKLSGVMGSGSSLLGMGVINVEKEL